jgi:hypothetical protein
LVLVALMVYVPAAVVVKVAERPLAVSVPADGVALQVTVPVHDELALSVAVSVDVAPVFIVVGLALTVTPVTVQVGVTLVVLLLEPQADWASTASTAAAEQTSARRRNGSLKDPTTGSNRMMRSCCHATITGDGAAISCYTT